MRALVQRVSRAAVSVAGDVIGRLDEPGLCVFVGVTHGDTEATAERMATKVYGLRVLRDERSCAETDAPLLVVSQFTLYGELRRGRRPTWERAAPAETAEPLVDHLVADLRRSGARVETGRFGADMQVELVNDGPITVMLELP